MTYSIASTNGPFSGEPMVTAVCGCGWELSAYTNGDEAQAREKLNKRFPGSHVCLGKDPTNMDDGMDMQEASTLGG